MRCDTKLQFKFGEYRTNGFGDIAFFVFFKMAAGGHLGFQNSYFLWHVPNGGTQRVIPAKFGPFRTNRFDAIAIFVNFNWSPAAILDFEKNNF